MEFPVDKPVLLRDRLDVAQLVSYLRRESRDRPVVLLTVAPNRTAPHSSADRIAAAAKGHADVVVLPSDELTFAFSDLVSPTASVYHGAGRVYPQGDTWERDPFSVPLRLARTEQEIKDQEALLIADLRLALTPPPPPPPIKPVSPDQPQADAVLAATLAGGSDAARLGSYLLSSQRRRPVVVVSRAATAAAAYADVEQLRRDLAGLADVFEISTLAASWAFSEAVPPMCQVYGGASRVYPLGTDWCDNPYMSPLRFAYSDSDRDRVTRALIADALAMCAIEPVTTATPAAAMVVRGTIIGVVGDRGVVKLDSGDLGVVWPELVESGLPADQLFTKGMVVNGTLDPDSRRIDVRAMRQDPHTAVAGYVSGDTILVRVASIDVESCDVELLPGVRTSIPAQDITDAIQVDLHSLMTVGETVSALVVERGGDAEWLLSVTEAAEAADAVAAPAVLAGGPPWLSASTGVTEAARVVLDEPAELVASEPLAGTVSAGNEEVLQGLQLENRQLAARVVTLEGTVRHLEQNLAQARTLRRESDKRRSRTARQSQESDGRQFLDDRAQLDFDLYVAWVHTTVAAEKEQRPLARYSYGPDFFTTLHSVEGVSRSKVVEVMVQVLTGRHTELASRELHQLRTGSGGDDPPVTREGGETCWRVALQTKTPSARRLHYWACNDGSIEFSSVRLHDDIKP
jgi:hypothetical protein